MLLEGIAREDLPIQFFDEPDTSADNAWGESALVVANNREYEALSRVISYLSLTEGKVDSGATYSELTGWLVDRFQTGQVIITISDELQNKNPAYGLFQYEDDDPSRGVVPLGIGLSLQIPRGFADNIDNYIPSFFAQAIEHLVGKEAQAAKQGQSLINQSDLLSGHTIRTTPVDIRMIPTFRARTSGEETLNTTFENFHPTLGHPLLGQMPDDPAGAEIIRIRKELNKGRMTEGPYAVVNDVGLKRLIAEPDSPNQPWWVRTARDVFSAMEHLPNDKNAVVFGSGPNTEAWKSRSWTTVDNQQKYNADIVADAYKFEDIFQLEPNSQHYILLEHLPFPPSGDEYKDYLLRLKNLLTDDGVLIIQTGSVDPMDLEKATSREYDNFRQYGYVSRWELGRQLHENGFETCIVLEEYKDIIGPRPNPTVQEITIIAKKI